MSRRRGLTLFLCGDVMTGRGIDQVLPHPCAPHLYEPAVTSALEYVALAERENGPIPRPVPADYVWGDVRRALERARPDARIINLETSITTSESPLPKGINYRMHPDNVAVLTAASIDCCVLANNHVLDWGEAGLLETMRVLSAAGIAFTGAGAERASAWAPAILSADSGARVLVLAVGAADSGVPYGWAAGPGRPGLAVLPDFSDEAVDAIAAGVAAVKRPGDVAVLSIHWGGNWGYEIPPPHRRFARALIDRAAVDVVHGHSSHHPKAIEVYRDRLILYGCGDFLNDYEGIRGYEEFRDDLVLAYFPAFAPDARLLRLEMMPFRIRNFRLHDPSDAERAWLRANLDRECRRFGHRVVVRGGGLLLE